MNSKHTRARTIHEKQRNIARRWQTIRQTAEDPRRPMRLTPESFAVFELQSYIGVEKRPLAA